MKRVAVEEAHRRPRRTVDSLKVVGSCKVRQEYTGPGGPDPGLRAGSQAVTKPGDVRPLV